MTVLKAEKARISELLCDVWKIAPCVWWTFKRPWVQPVQTSRNNTRCFVTDYRPYEENILRNAPKIPIASFSFSLLKVGILLVKRAEMLKILIFRGGIPTFKNETQTGQVVFLGCFPRFYLCCCLPGLHSLGEKISGNSFSLPNLPNCFTLK